MGMAVRMCWKWCVFNKEETSLLPPQSFWALDKTGVFAPPASESAGMLVGNANS